MFWTTRPIEVPTVTFQETNDPVTIEEEPKEPEEPESDEDEDAV